MAPEFDRFLSLALGPERPDDRKKEERAILKGELLERLHNHRPGPDDLTLEEASTRLEKAWSFRWLRKGSRLLCLLLPLVLLLVTIYDQLPDYFVARAIPEWLPGPLKRRMADRKYSLTMGSLPHGLPRYIKDDAGFPLAPQPPPEAMSPAQLQDQILDQAPYRQKVPVELVEALQKADPDNGWLSFYLASRKATEIAYNRSSKDTERVEETLELLRQAAEKPKFISYTRLNSREQLAVFRPPETSNEQSAIYSALASDAESNASSRIQSLLDEQARRMIGAGQFEQVLELTCLARKLAILQLAQPGAAPANYTPLDSFGLNLKSRMKDPKLDEAKQVWSEFETIRKTGAAEIRKLDSIWWFNSEAEVADNLKSGTYPAHYSNAYIPADLQRRSAIIHGNDAFRMAWGSCALVVISSVATGFLRAKRNRLWLAGNLSPIYGWRSSLGILLIGFLLPLAAWWFQIWHTRFGCTDLPAGFVEIPRVGEFPWRGQYLAAPLIIWLCSLQWAKHEKARHFSFLGPRPRFVRTGWIPALLAVSLPSLYGMVRLFPTRMGDWTMIIASIHGCLIVWLLWEILGPKSVTLDSLLVTGLTGTSIAAVSIAASLGIFLAKAEERQAIHRLNEYQAQAILRNSANGVEKVRIWRSIFADDLR